MRVEEIRDLFAAMLQAGVVEVEIGAGAERVRVVRHSTGGTSAPSTAPPAAAEVDGRTITSPLAGIIAERLVSPGSRLVVGREIVVIAANGMLTAVESEVSGTVEAVLITAGQHVEVGGALLRVADGS